MPERNEVKPEAAEPVSKLSWSKKENKIQALNHRTVCGSQWMLAFKLNVNQAVIAGN